MLLPQRPCPLRRSRASSPKGRAFSCFSQVCLLQKGASPMKRRTFISLMSVMAAAGVLSLAGCSSNTSASTASSTAASASASAAAANKLETIQSNGKLVIALEGAWQPWSFHDESDTLVGYDVEVSRAIAEKLGVEPEYVESDWDSLFAGLDAGRYDLVCNGVEVTEERAKTYDFTTPYGYIHTALAVRRITRTSRASRTSPARPRPTASLPPTWSWPRATARPSRHRHAGRDHPAADRWPHRRHPERQRLLLRLPERPSGRRLQAGRPDRRRFSCCDPYRQERRLFLPRRPQQRHRRAAR